MNITIDLKRPIKDLRSELLANVNNHHGQSYIKKLKKLEGSYEKLKCENIHEEELKVEAIDLIKSIIMLCENAQWSTILTLVGSTESIVGVEYADVLKKNNGIQSSDIDNRIIDKRVENDGDEVTVIVTTADQNVFVAYSSIWDDPKLNEKTALKEIISELNARV